MNSNGHEVNGLAVREKKSGINTALKDVTDSLRQHRIAFVFGWQDVAQRYRRSRVGAFWLTLNMAVYVGSLGLIFGTLFRSDMRDYLPHLCIGVMVWSFISTSINDGCVAFSSSSGVILQVKMPLFLHVMRTVWKNIIIFMHNILIIPILYFIVGKSININILFIIPGFILVVLNILWINTVLATLCARFRDITQIVTNIMQVMFYATPILWTVQALPSHVSHAFFELNPFYHFIQLVRSPLFGEVPEIESWIVSILTCLVGWCFTLLFFGRYRWRVAYWL